MSTSVETMNTDLENSVDEMLGLGDTKTNEAPENQQASDTEAQPSLPLEGGQDDKQSEQPAKPSTEQPVKPAKPESSKPVIRPNTLPANANGDLIDPKTQKVIARAGTERQYYELARNSLNENNKIKQEITSLRDKISTYEAATTMHKELGLEPNESVIAMQFMAKYKTDPLGAAKELLTDLRARGYAVEELGGSSIDTAALARMMDERLKPFTSEREAQAKDQEIQSVVAREYDAVAERYPWITSQDAEIAALIKADPTLDLRTAALELQAYALRMGYDLEQSITEQHNMRQESPPQQQAPQTPRPNRAQMSVPNTSADVPVMPKKAEFGNPSNSKDLIRSTLAEYGFRLER